LSTAVHEGTVAFMHTMDATPEQRTYARAAGVMFLLKYLLEGTGDYITIISRSGEPLAATARLAAESGVLWRSALLSVVLAWLMLGGIGFAFYVMLVPVNKRLAQLALYLRAGACFIGAGAMSFRFAEAWLFRATLNPELFSAPELRMLESVLRRGAGAGIETAWMLQSLSSVLFFILLLRSRFIPAPLARLGIFGSALLFPASCLMYVFPAYINELKLWGVPGALVELVTAVLLIKGIGRRTTAEVRA
jgi:hypothetical protein